MAGRESGGVLDAQFLEWLRANGGRFPKIVWPSCDTLNGIRGAVATETIETNEVMLEIPKHLMMSEKSALDDPVIGPYLTDRQRAFSGDSILAIFMMSEFIKGDASFFSPFLKIIPPSDSIVEWVDEELRYLQDEVITMRAKNRRAFMKDNYRRTVETLTKEYPEVFPPEKYTYELFKHCWYAILARAFGRRLPWSAMVPFADCLNHSNVQTKYDYDVDQNGMFRMFPTGRNRYAKGVEVFNSYGRRKNDNLLMEYGFALLENHWEEVEVRLTIQTERRSDPPPVPGLTCADSRSIGDSLARTNLHYAAQTALLRSMDMQPSILAKMKTDCFPLEALAYSRIACLDPSALERLRAEATLMEAKRRSARDDRPSDNDSDAQVAQAVEESGTEGKKTEPPAQLDQRFLRELIAVFDGYLETAQSSSSRAEVNPFGAAGPPVAYTQRPPHRSSSRSSSRHQGVLCPAQTTSDSGSAFAPLSRCRLPITVSTELAAVRYLLQQLHAHPMGKAAGTASDRDSDSGKLDKSMQFDEVLYEQLTAGNSGSYNVKNSRPTGVGAGAGEAGDIARVDGSEGCTEHAITSNETASPNRLLTALVYRLTRKRILQTTISRLRALETYLSAVHDLTEDVPRLTASLLVDLGIDSFGARRGSTDTAAEGTGYSSASDELGPGLSNRHADDVDVEPYDSGLAIDGATPARPLTKEGERELHQYAMGLLLVSEEYIGAHH